MAKTGTYALIASNTLGSATASVTFSSIPATFTDLVLVISGLVSNNTYGIWLQANTDTGTNYSWTSLSGNGTAAASTRQSSRANTENWIGNAATGWSNTTTNNIISHIFDYANTTTYKTILSRSNNASGGVESDVNLWRSTVAINQIVIGVQSTGTMSSGTTLKLYGIQAYNGAV